MEAPAPNRLKSALKNTYERKMNCVNINIVNKTVNFLKTVRVCLIPRREEFAPIKHNIWWKSDDYEVFRASAVCELFTIMNVHECTLKEGMSILYGLNNTNSISVNEHNHCDIQTFKNIINQI